LKQSFVRFTKRFIVKKEKVKWILFSFLTSPIFVDISTSLLDEI